MNCPVCKSDTERHSDLLWCGFCGCLIRADGTTIVPVIVGIIKSASEHLRGNAPYRHRMEQIEERLGLYGYRERCTDAD